MRLRYRIEISHQFKSRVVFKESLQEKAEEEEEEEQEEKEK